MQNTSPVRMNKAALEVFAQELADATLEAPEWREPWYPEDDDADFVQFLGVANALNFCYTEPGHEKFAVAWNDMTLAGSAGLMAALMRAREEGTDILNPYVLERLVSQDINTIFRSDAGPLPLMSFRDVYLRSLGRELRFRGFGSFLDFFEACDFDAAVIIPELIERFTAYGGDACLLPDGTLFRFDKRARLLPLMYEGRARSSDGALRTLENVDAIGPVIDYQVAKTLRANGVLIYTAELDEKIAKGIPLTAWEEEEVYIRIAAHEAVILLLLSVNGIRADRGQEPITMVELDFALWSAGRRLKEISHHLCLTTAY